jgi:hypothetical protein
LYLPSLLRQLFSFYLNFIFKFGARTAGYRHLTAKIETTLGLVSYPGKIMTLMTSSETQQYRRTVRIVAYVVGRFSVSRNLYWQ